MARRKQEQHLEEKACAEREAAREAAKANCEDVHGAMMKKKQSGTNAKRKGRSKAQKEASAKALEKVREAMRCPTPSTSAHESVKEYRCEGAGEGERGHEGENGVGEAGRAYTSIFRYFFS